MSYTYDKTITADINGPVLKTEIDAAVSNVLGWGISGSTYSFVKTTAWSSSDQTTLDSVVAAHNGELADEPVQEDPDNRTKLGYGALAKATTASACVAIGEFALEECLTGDENVAVGCRALQDTTSGKQNSAFGHRAGRYNLTGNYNSAFGWGSGEHNTSGEFNTAYGNDSLSLNETGSNNTAIGHKALCLNTVSENTAVGSNALAVNSTADGLVAVGYKSLYANISGNDNVAVGYESLEELQSGDNNVAVGKKSLNKNISGDDNVAVGCDALRYNTAPGITGIGHEALTYNTSGTHNTALGAYTLAYSEEGENNTGLGYNSLHYAGYGSETVSHNTAVGSCSLENLTTGENNTAMGSDVLISLVTGDGNIAIGRDAGKEYDGGESNNILIGNDGVHEDDAVIRIGNSQTSAFLKGVHGVTPTGATETVIIDANGEMGSTASAGGSANIVMHSFGGKMDSTYKYAVVNGNSDDSDQSDTPKTRCPVAAGTIIKMVFKSEDASTSTKLQFKKNGSNIGNNFSLPGSSGTVLPASFGTITFNDGDYIQLLRTHDPDPNRSIWNVFVELT